MVGTRMQCLVWLDRPQRRLPSRHTQGNLSAGKIGKKEKEEAGRVAFCRHRGSDKVSSAEQAVRWFTDLTLLICVSGKRHRWRAVAEGRVDDVTPSPHRSTQKLAAPLAAACSRCTMAVVLGGAEASPLSWDGYGWLACAPVPVPVFCFFPALGGLDDPRNALPHSIKGVDGQPSLPCNSIRSQWVNQLRVGLPPWSSARSQ